MQFDCENSFNRWHAGDTGVFSDMKMMGDIHKAVIPMHHGPNPSLLGTPAEFSKALGASAMKVLAITPGEMLEF